MFQSFIYLRKRLSDIIVTLSNRFSYFISHSFFSSQLVFLMSVSLLSCYDFWACVMLFWLQSWVCFFLCCYLAFQIFTRKLCLRFSRLTMRNFRWNRFPIKNFLAYTHRGEYLPESFHYILKIMFGSIFNTYHGAPILFCTTKDTYFFNVK